jgi:hypothetical protein
MMSNETFSLIIQCWHDQVDGLRVRVVRVDTGQDVPINDGTFLLRITTDTRTKVERCFIRHIASGQEAYLQGGPKLRRLIADYMLLSQTPDAGTANEIEPDA